MADLDEKFDADEIVAERSEEERLADFNVQIRAALEENLEAGEDAERFRDALLVFAAELG